MKDFWTSTTINPFQKGVNRIVAPMKSFNKEVARIKPTFLIVDIEGGEYELVKDADFRNIKKIMIELHEDIIGRKKIEFIKNKFKQYGFKQDRSVGSVELWKLK